MRRAGPWNRKTDFSMTSGPARVFKEQFYIFELLGEFSECRILSRTSQAGNKEDPSGKKADRPTEAPMAGSGILQNMISVIFLRLREPNLWDLKQIHAYTSLT